MTIHPQAQAVVDGNTWGHLDPDTVGIAALREAMNTRLIELAGRGPDLAAVNDVSIKTDDVRIPVRIYKPRNSDAAPPVYVYFHSGGYCVYDIDTADAQCRVMARDADCVVVSVGYRLAPEAPFPAAAEDAWAALRWIVEEAGSIGIDADRVAVGGESCGGTLATVCALRARDAGHPTLRQVVLSCALLEMGAPRPGETRTLATWMRDQYLTTPGAEDDFRASPLRHPDLGHLPPHLLLTGEHDGLREQAYQYAERLKQAGTMAELHDFPGMIHNFTGMRAALDDAQHGLDLIARTLRSAFSVTP